jgi:hypothetical protein
MGHPRTALVQARWCSGRAGKRSRLVSGVTLGTMPLQVSIYRPAAINLLSKCDSWLPSLSTERSLRCPYASVEHSERRLRGGELRASDQDQSDGGPRCPLSDQELAYWARNLRSLAPFQQNEPAGQEQRLLVAIADCFERARSLYRLLTLPPNWPQPLLRVEIVLPEIAGRLEASRQELLSLPGSVTAGLRVRFANYDLAITALGALPFMLNQVAAIWKAPRKRRPHLRNEAEAIGLLIQGVEQYTGEALPPPRSEKRQAEFEFVRLLTGKLFPSLTDRQFKTALGHWHKSRPKRRRG